MLRHAYGNEAMCRATCFEWHVCFKRCRTSLEDDERSGRLSTSSTPTNVETIRWLVHEDRRITIKKIAAIVNVSYGTVQTIFTRDMNMHRIAAKFMPRLLTPEQKGHRVEICEELRQHAMPWMTHPSCRGLLLGMRVGSTGMIPRVNNSLRNGRVQDPQDRRRPGRATARSKACSSCFSTLEGLCIMSLSPKARP